MSWLSKRIIRKIKQNGWLEITGKEKIAILKNLDTRPFPVKNNFKGFHELVK